MFTKIQPKRKQRNLYRLVSATVILSLSLVAAGCSSAETDSQPSASHAQEQHERLLPNGDLQQTTASRNDLPPFLDDKKEEMRLIYTLAAQNHELLQHIPCYCGCGEIAGHESNLNCFVAQMEDDGAVQWDDHGTRCGVCLEIAVEASQMQREGKSMRDIRQAIDEKYKEGYAEPTPTPLPTV
ncbi:PCYCGC domain-containing protein [Paenibacillus profundus]|uniref:PCYCGC domain-containing protein n=1 Tax=Paenibacillus profundus TaxID=1173085 RepID=A0ABS8YLD0_9BACL|nr:PCYCGC domain-containing protein [Paenibacillus profundus]MCE5171739.1 PCYCGC domain-containing protein [Paenibacillus profundus]